MWNFNVVKNNNTDKKISDGKMTTIGLIRHGITEWNTMGKAQGISNIPLNSLEKQQAMAIANRLLQEEKWDILITSDMSRAIETGEIIGQKINLPISHIEKRVREIDCGKIKGQRWKKGFPNGVAIGVS